MRSELGKLGIVLGLLAMPAGAHACGGFFCNAQTPVPIVQAGERVLFAKKDGLTHMHIEVAYQGQPTQFGWVLPLSELPLGADGEPLPLDEALALSHEAVFDRLEEDTDPVHRRVIVANDSQCSSAAADVWSGPNDGSVGSDTGPLVPPPLPPTVTLVDEASVGPYEAIVLKTESADDLFNWLNASGYQQDPAARPIFESYVAQNFVFLALRLTNGVATGDLRPVALTLGEEAPCVPLRLTAIAATENMPIYSYVLGPARAIPKNYLHAQVNPKALEWPDPNNYFEVVSSAIDEASGRAWITEFSGPTTPFSGRISTISETAAEAVMTGATNVLDLTTAYVQAGFPTDATYTSIVMAEVPMPAGLLGFPYGNCLINPASPPEASASCPPNEDHVTTESEFYGYLDWWLAQPQVIVEVDVDALRTRLMVEVVRPLTRAQALIDGTTTLTRMYTSMDPSEMTKDPIFAFNSELPPVDRTQTVEVAIAHEGNKCGLGTLTATYPNGSTHVFECSGDCSSSSLNAVADEPALDYAEVTDETGQPTRLHNDDVDMVDGLLGLAVIGAPSLPADLMLALPVERTRETRTLLDQAGTSAQSDSAGGCQVGNQSNSAIPVAVGFALAMLLFVRRKLSIG
ncbi:MAG: hypothetical protein ACI9OJ_003299 [Myxococcota bacterium]|jgi:hypothetical protein